MTTWQSIKDFPKYVEEGTSGVFCHGKNIFLLEKANNQWCYENDYGWGTKDIYTFTHFLILPPLPDPDEGKPTFADLKGTAPNITGDMSSEDYVNKLREKGWPEHD